MATSSGHVLLWSFWCHSSIIPPFAPLRDCTSRISSRIRWPMSPSPPLPMVVRISPATGRSAGCRFHRPATRFVNRVWAALISRGFTL